MNKKILDLFDYLLNKKNECLLKKCNLLKERSPEWNEIARYNGIIEGLNISIDLFSDILQNKIYTNKDIEDVEQ